MIDVVIPTLWKVASFPQALQGYSKDPSIGNIIVVSNAKPPYQASSDRVKVIGYHKNIFVNPAWNEGFALCSSGKICILNDDLVVGAKVFDSILHLNIAPGQIIGLDPSPTQEEFNLERIALDYTKPLGSQFYGFGSCMFMLRETYTPIPSIYKIWFGDDFLVHNSSSLWRFSSKYVQSEMSRSLRDLESEVTVQERLKVDIRNAEKFLLSGEK